MCVAVNSLAVLLHTVLDLDQGQIVGWTLQQRNSPCSASQKYRHFLNKKRSQHMKAAVASS